MRLAHFSDIHVTHFPFSVRGGLALKRLAAVASYSLGRRAHFAASDARVAALLRDIDSLGVDHAICTGDVTGVSTAAEFEQVAELFGPERLSAPQKYTVIPGNHDRYVSSAAGHFEKYFGAVSSDRAEYPLVKSLPGNVTLVCADSARATNVIDSSGLVGEAQRQKLFEILTGPSLETQFVVLAFHYGLLRMNGERDGRNHGLRDDLEMIELVDRLEVNLDLVIHGHLHRPFRIRTKQRTILNAGSATDLHVNGAGYNVYDIDASTHRVQIVRRAWSVDMGAYIDDPSSPVVGEVSTR